MPPGVYDYRFVFAYYFVIPAPDVGLDGFAYRGHVLEVVVVFLGLIEAGFAEHADGGGRGVEDVDVEALGDAPGSARVGELGHAFVEDAGGAERERAIDDVGVAGDPADVGHAPVDVIGVDVLVILRGAGDVGQIASGAVLAAFGLAGSAAGVHEEQRGFGVLRDGVNDVIAVVVEDVFDEVIAAHDHWGFGAEVVGVALPDQDFVDVLAFFFRGFYGDVGAGFVIDPFAVAVITVSVDEDAAAGVGGAQAAGFAAEAAEDHRVDHAQAGAGQHGDRKLRDHGHVDGDAVAGF